MLSPGSLISAKHIYILIISTFDNNMTQNDDIDNMNITNLNELLFELKVIYIV